MKRPRDLLPHLLSRVFLLGALALTFACSEPASEPPPEPPRPAAQEILDPRLAERIEKQLAHLNHHPIDATRWRDLGLLYQAHNLFDLALMCYQQGLELAPDDPRLLFHLAQVERRLGLPEAREHLTQVTALTNYAPALWHLALWHLEDGAPENAREAAERAHVQAPDDRGAVLVRARIAQQLGEPQATADLLEAHLGREPWDADAHLLLGRAYQRLGRDEEAAVHLDLGQGAEGLYYDPWSDAVDALQTNFGAALRAATTLVGEDAPRAVVELEALRQERPENVTVLTNLGIGYRRLGRLEDSVAVLEKAVERHPGRGLAHFQLAATRLELLRRPAAEPLHELLRQAFRHIDRALELQPTVPHYHALRGELLVLAGKTEEAVQEYGLAVAREPIDLAWLPRLGTLLCKVYRFREAIPVLEHHRQRAGDTPETLLMLGVAYANSGDLAAAGNVLERARALRPEDASIRQALAQLLKATENRP